MKYNCPIPEFEECYVEMSENWTRGQVKTFFSASGEAYVQVLKKKILSINLKTENGAITLPEELTEANIENVDMILWKWFSTAINAGIDRLYSLGEEIAQSWLKEQGTMTAQKEKDSLKQK